MDINKKIAESKGLKVKGNEFVPEDKLHLVVPKYTTDPALILELVLELGKAYWLYTWTPILGHQWTKEGKHIDDKDFGMVTALAYIEEKGL